MLPCLQLPKEKYHVISFNTESKKTKNHIPGYREQVVAVRGRDGGGGMKWGKGGHKLRTSIYKIKKSWKCNVQHGDYSYFFLKLP